jgi:hypothetical protein
MIMRRTRKVNVSEQHDPRGIYSQVVGNSKGDEEEIDTTVSSDVPIEPGQQMATQLSTARPPVDDETYTPVSVSELSSAASALMDGVPPSQVAWYYKQMRKLIDDAKERVDSEEVDVATIDEARVRDKVRRLIMSLISEQSMIDPDDEVEFEEYRTGNKYSTGGVDYFGDEDEVLVPALDTSEGMGLEDLAARYGYSGASGIRQEINRLTNRMEYFATKVKPDDLEALLDFAAGEYVDVMSLSDLLDPDDITELQAAPGAVKSLDSFRFFFVSAFVLPAYKQVSKGARDKVMSEIEALGIPKEIHQTVYNQVSGATKKKPQLINKKLMALAQKGAIKPEEVSEIQGKIRSAASLLQTIGDLSDDLVQRALDTWQSMSKGKKKSLLKKAIEQTVGYGEADK